MTQIWLLEVGNWSSTDKDMYHSDPIKCIFLESFWSGDVKYCIFGEYGPEYLGHGTKYWMHKANIWPTLSKYVNKRQVLNQICSIFLGSIWLVVK